MYGDKMDKMRTRFVGYSFEDARDVLWREHCEGVTLARDYQAQLDTLDKIHGNVRSDIERAPASRPVKLNRNLLQCLAKSAAAINSDIAERLAEDDVGFVSASREVYEWNRRSDVKNLTVRLVESCDLDGNVNSSKLGVAYNIVVTKVRRVSKTY